MLRNKLTSFLIFAVSLVAGLSLVVKPAIALDGQLSVPDADSIKSDIQVLGYTGESVTFTLTITFDEVVTDFDASDIELLATWDDNGTERIITNGATAGPVTPNNRDSVVYTSHITAKSDVEKVWIEVDAGAAKTPGTVIGGNHIPGDPTNALDQIIVEIVRRAPPPTELTLSGNTNISGNAVLTLTLTSTTAIMLTSADIKVTGGYVNTLTSDPSRKIWTVNIIRYMNETQITVESADPTKYTFPRRTFTIDALGPVATITGTPPAIGGAFVITISFNEPLQTNSTLVSGEITVTNGTLTALTAIANTNDYTATITPNHGVTTVTVQVNANAVADAYGNPNAVTPLPAHAFTVTATTPLTRTEPSLEVIFSEIANRTDNTNEWIEFKNRSGQEQNVNGWIVSIVTRVNSDVELFKLPDVTIPDGDVLLVTDKDPDDEDSSLSAQSPLRATVDIGDLPNDGNFMLILRKSSNVNYLGTANEIADVAGYYPNSTQGTTALWPLNRYTAPLDENKLQANRVYWRQYEDIAGTSSAVNADTDPAFQPIGFTGIGYKRAADQTNENGGTPGYPNDIRKSRVTALTGKVTISEIMFATNGGVNDIQWIELYNSSKTDAVALDADDGWSLYIENYNDPNTTNEPPSGVINFKDNGNVKTILPNQTVLIVSSSRGRNSDNALFPSNRVFSVYDEVADEFGMINLRRPFLNPTVGFYIALFDGNNRKADEAGNLDNRPRSAPEPIWELPEGRTDNGYRTSIIRRYRNYNPQTRSYSNKDVAHDGTQPEGWILAASTDFSYFLRHRKTWYGNSTDYGTPGIRAGQALPVKLSQFRPERTEAGTVVIKWTTESELNNAGFNILRSRTQNGEFKTVNAQLIQGAGTSSERNTYTWTDTTAQPNVVYYYRIEDMSFAGERQILTTSRLKGLISAKGKITTQWAELKKSRD